MMPTAFEFENGELVDSYDLGEAECPICRYPVIGHFKSGVLVETEACKTFVAGKFYEGISILSPES